MKDLAGLLNYSSVDTFNISIYRALSESSYVKLPAKLRSSKEGLMNIKNNDQESFFFGVMLGILILQKYIQEELHEKIKNWS